MEFLFNNYAENLSLERFIKFPRLYEIWWNKTQKVRWCILFLHKKYKEPTLYSPLQRYIVNKALLSWTRSLNINICSANIAFNQQFIIADSFTILKSLLVYQNKSDWTGIIFIDRNKPVATIETIPSLQICLYYVWVILRACNVSKRTSAIKD